MENNRSLAALLSIMSLLTNFGKSFQVLNNDGSIVKAVENPDQIVKTPYVMSTMQDYSQVIAFQAFIWVSILLVIVTGCIVCMMLRMDADKHKDTLVYAKFLANVKDK